MPSGDEKSRLRSDALRRRRAVGTEAMARASRAVGENLRSLKEYQGAKLIASYCAKEEEVQTRPIIERAIADGKRVAVAVTDPASKTLRFSEIRSYDELAPGHFGIPEPLPGHERPVALSEADLVLVPMVAWDERGHRIGYGVGYFDRALAGTTRATKVGLAIESQKVERVPEEAHDVPLDAIVTEKRVVRANRGLPRKHSKTQ